MSGTPGEDREAEEQLLALLGAAKAAQAAVDRLPGTTPIGAGEVARILGYPGAAVEDLITNGGIPSTTDVDGNAKVRLVALREYIAREETRQREGMKALADFQNEHGLVY